MNAAHTPAAVPPERARSAPTRRLAAAVIALSVAFTGGWLTRDVVFAAEKSDAPPHAAPPDAEVREVLFPNPWAVTEPLITLKEFYDAMYWADIYEWSQAWKAEQARLAAATKPRRSEGGAGESLAAIRACESGGDYGAVSPDGQYRGAYQFDQGTWESVGGTGDPAAAAPAEQDARAAELQRQRGNQPWPVCGR